MNRSIVFRIFLTLVLLGALAGVGVLAYNAGLTQAGMTQVVQTTGGEGPGSMHTYMYGAPFEHSFGMHAFGLLVCLVPLFLLFLFFAAMRALIWHGPHGWHRRGMMGHWDSEDGVP